MARTAKVVVILVVLVFLQVSHAAGQVHDVPAVMSVNGFAKGEEGGPARCDGVYHSDALFFVALSSKWYGTGLRCGKKIGIRSSDALYVEAMVVDECDTENGCGDNEISTSAAVWKFFGLDTNVGEVTVTWSDVN
jgi:hypothetical protein